MVYKEAYEENQAILERNHVQLRVCLVKQASSPLLCSDREQSYTHPSCLLKYRIKGDQTPSHRLFGVFETLGD